jgi:hypothetical protein
MPNRSNARPARARDYAARTPSRSAAAAEGLCARADALCRAASEVCRQHARYARLIAIDACDEEERAAGRVIELCDDLLGELSAAYGVLAALGPRADPPGANGGADGWHQGNMLLLASREYLRLREACERAQRAAARRDASRGADLLVELTTAFELRASALLALQHAVDAYRKARPV